MAETKRIIILMAEAGFGHRSAAQAIAAALQELYADECSVDILNPMTDERVPAFLRNTTTGYDEFVREWPDLYQLGYKLSDEPLPTALVDGVLVAGLFQAVRDIVHSHQPDAIVVVHPDYLAPLAAVFARDRRRVPVVTVVTDLTTVHQAWFNQVTDLCLVATPEAQEVAVRDGMPAGRVKVTGIPVSPQLSRETRAPAALRTELGWDPDLTTVLAAGSKRTRHLPDVLHVLNHSGLPLQLAVVAGGDDEFYRRLQETQWHRVTHLYNFVDNMPTLLRAADCILGKAGGLIVSEALACGRPILLADVIQGQETGNAEYVVAGGAGELASDPIAALEILCHWLDGGGRLLQERAENARRLGRPRAAHDIAASVWDLAQRGPGGPRRSRRSPAHMKEEMRLRRSQDKQETSSRNGIMRKETVGGHNDPAK